jgi:hypothetical protein
MQSFGVLEFCDEQYGLISWEATIYVSRGEWFAYFDDKNI